MSGSEEHGPPWTVFTPVWEGVRETSWGKSLGFAEPDRNLGQLRFESLCFSVVAVGVLMGLTLLAYRRPRKVPTGVQNLMEGAVELLRTLVVALIGPQGARFVPYLGTLFLFILTLNLLGIIPAFRSPTMTLTTTASLGVTTFFVVQYYGIRENGLWGYAKHFAGEMIPAKPFVMVLQVLLLAPLMFAVHVVGELAKPLSLSLRLFGNISGEDTVIESLMVMGGWVPIQFPMLIFAVFTSVLQAFVFMALSSIYISTVTSHGEDHGEHHEH